MNYTITKDNEEIIMKLLHYFITLQNYNPVILHGAKDEIWLENLDSDYKIIRIVSNYIHNNEQLDFDIYKTKQIMKSIRKKTLSLKVPTLSIFVNLGENVHMDNNNYDYITCLNVKTIDDVISNKDVLSVFPDINKTNDYKEKGMELFLKLTSEINEKNKEDAIKAEEVFKVKKPIITYALILINVIVFLSMYLFGNGSNDTLTLVLFGANNRELVLGYNQYFRLITSAFLHIGITHLVFNMYALYVIGSQIENFFGKAKYILIYLGSAIFASILSICFSNSLSAGASGAIFGLLGAMLYFGYHYRLYLGNTIKSQILPIILINLLFGFLMNGIDNAAHIGGLIGGILLSMICGVKYKSSKIERINGFILTIIYTIFLVILINGL